MDAVEVRVRGTALRWESDDFPGWIRVSVPDSERNEHLIVEKVPVLTSDTVTAEGPFPMELWVAAQALSVADGKVEVALSHDVETEVGERLLTVLATDVIWL